MTWRQYIIIHFFNIERWTVVIHIFESFIADADDFYVVSVLSDLVISRLINIRLYVGCLLLGLHVRSVMLQIERFVINLTNWIRYKVKQFCLNGNFCHVDLFNWHWLFLDWRVLTLHLLVHHDLLCLLLLVQFKLFFEQLHLFFYLVMNFINICWAYIWCGFIHFVITSLRLDFAHTLFLSLSAHIDQSFIYGLNT